ncbi:acetyltransferase (GNAT) family protein [Herbihabitans rhizosphaerae]|uniref:Acetyltransferase (GNAT) family protein n=1 Tax=Herbihabitans rhizosphaerae TaxID=1872711 RepID=A0A4V2ERQ7_9PSEU|nr:acetyltransferase (GNAT) family protein [Herbihabitans rhizosphaerae]
MRAGVPHLAIGRPEMFLWLVENAPAAQRLRAFVAELDGQVVGVVRANLHNETSEPGQASANLTVHPDHRGKGAGTALITRAEEYLREIGATQMYSWAVDEPRALAFAERHGFRLGSAATFQRLDLTGELPAIPATPDGISLATAADYADDPRPVYDVDVEATLDEPSDVDAVSYSDWLAMHWERPDLDRELSVLAVADGVIVAFTSAMTDGRTRYFSGMTGSRRAVRGQGLAKLVKAHSLHRARAAGYTEAFTGNDLTNQPMLAINRWFGYQPAQGERRAIRDL